MNTKEMCDLLSFVAMINSDGLLNNSCEDTIKYFHENYKVSDKWVKHHIEHLIVCAYNNQNRINLSTFKSDNLAENIYFHGELENLVKSDLVETKDTLREGIFDVNVEGINKPCVLYVWKAGKSLKGLAVLKSDTQANTYAYNCYKNKTNII